MPSHQNLEMDPSLPGKTEILWTPSAQDATEMNQFREAVNLHFSLNLKNYHELQKWSCREFASFWEFLFEYSQLVVSKKWTQVIDQTKFMDDIPEWFLGARLNYAENLLRFAPEKTAIIQAGEGQTPHFMTFGKLKQLVAQISFVLRTWNVQPGDRVVGYLPNCKEAVAFMLAAASIGAMWSSTSADFGITGVLERFSQIQPKVIFSVNAVRYNGKIHDHSKKLASVVRALTGLEKVVVLNFVPEHHSDLSIDNSIDFESFLKLSPASPPLRFEQLPFSHPLFIMFSSGTTGTPKCIVHSAGGTLLQHHKEHRLQAGLRESDTLFYYSTTGWMMWNYLVSGLSVGAAIVCYDGSPFIPNLNTLWDLTDQLHITVFGTSAKWLATIQDKGLCPMKTNQLGSIRAILSTGSPLKPDSFDYVYQNIKSNVLLGSITGGTDIISCFAGPCTALPVIRGEIQGFNLGMDCHCWDEDGTSLLDTSGELVCTSPFPSMPVKFWNDPDGSKYRNAYFSKFPHVWAHGDHCILQKSTGGILMLGRSDGTLNPAGVRFGSAEIYHITERFPEVYDSLCVGQKLGNDERVVLFLMLHKNAGIPFDDIVKKVVAAIRNELSARHVPAFILPIQDIPYTISGKKVEVAVKNIISGEEPKCNKSALRNPESLNLFYNLPALKLPIQK